MKHIKITPTQERLIAWGLQSIRFETDGQIKSARNLLKKLGEDTYIRGY